MSRFKNAVPLHVFVRQQQVIQLYRQYLRHAKLLPDKELSSEIRKQIVGEFHRNSKITDNVAIRTLVQEGNRELAKLIAMVPPNILAAHPSTSKSKSVNSKTSTKRSWLEESDENDQRGRVGTGWPWAR